MQKNACLPDCDITKLWREYQCERTSVVREQLVTYYLYLVKLVAGRVAVGLPLHIDKDDLISNGFFGLLDAIERFDLSRNIKFETYASTRIRGAILDFLRAQDWVPTSLRQKARKYEQALSNLESRLGRTASDEEIAVELGLSTKQLATLLTELNSVAIISLDEFVNAEIPISDADNPLQHIEFGAVKESLAEAIDALPEKERIVVSLYYYEELTLREISLVLKLTEARISQLHTKAIMRLRSVLLNIKSSLL